MQQIPVRLGAGRDRSYTITITDAVLEQLPRLLQQMMPGSQPFVITDATVRRIYGKRLLAAFERAGQLVPVIEVPAGEDSKNAELVFAIQTELLNRGVHRDSVIVAFGGGVIGDLAGFVAATILRGIAFVQVPTTLLAQVDSSVGGKVGIDHPIGKNLIGAFHQPRAVLIDVALLRTLPDREFRSGLAEAVKIAAALDAEFFRFIARNARHIKRTNTSLLERIVARSIGLKAAVVMDDEYEHGIRKALNLGHTIGHAIEASSGYRVLHGEAVSIGMAAESDIAVGLGLMQERDRNSMIRALRALKLKTELPSIRHREQFFRALQADKKTVGGKVRFVLPSAIGACALGVEVPSDVIERVIERHR